MAFGRTRKLSTSGSPCWAFTHIPSTSHFMSNVQHSQDATVANRDKMRAQQTFAGILRSAGCDETTGLCTIELPYEGPVFHNTFAKLVPLEATLY